MPKLYDISPPVSSQSALFPEDTRLKQDVVCDFKNSPVFLTQLTCSPHVGAHADAPSHYDPKGISIDQVDLDPYLGECWVVTCSRRPLILAEDCKAVLEKKMSRVLFRTLSQPDVTIFNDDFAAFSAEAVDLMGQAKVKLIGIDTPSIDPAKSKDLPAHQAVRRQKMRNLENLYLKDVPDGRYELIALPLKLVGFDASPVRAVLRELR